ncbi:FAS1 domain-containing protein [Penicillium longicatenatum]|nr:FAS1 domain-containing protein [Penicillium longicatenatum]
MAASTCNVQRWLDATASTEHDLDFLGHQYHGYKHALMTCLSGTSMNDMTIYESLHSRLDNSNFTKLVDACSPVKELLQNPEFCSTVWVPRNDLAEPFWGDIPKKDLQEFLHRHISPGFSPIYFLLTAPTDDTLLWSPELNGVQRVTLRPSLEGMRINNYSKIVESDYHIKNGLIHFIDQPIPSAPSIKELIMALPSQEFGAFQKAFQLSDLYLGKIGYPEIRGGFTVFIPTNAAFDKLSEAERTLIFSDEGDPYLKTLIEYHVGNGQTLHSNRCYDADTPPGQFAHEPSPTPNHTIPTPESQDDPIWRVLKGKRRFVLSTSIEDHDLSVDITRVGGLISMSVNGIANVTVQNGLASDGVCYIIDSVLCPSIQKPEQTRERDTSLDMRDVLRMLMPATESIELTL